MLAQLNIKVKKWVENLENRGGISFSLHQLMKELPNNSEVAIKSALKRLSGKGKVVSIHKGFYLIITPQYAVRGILPPLLFMDSFMNYLKRPYYVGTLSAAALYGAAHQQPQEFFVVTKFPVMRPTHKKGIKVNYISKQNIEGELLQDRKTETGYLKVSSAALTASDLVQYEKRTGGINRVTTVLNELTEEMDPAEFNEAFFSATPTTVIQRLGYLLDIELENKTLANRLFEKSLEYELSFFRIPLKSSVLFKGFSSDNRWSVIANIDIEIDE